MKSKKLLSILLPVSGVAIIATCVAILFMLTSPDNSDKNEAPIHALSGNEAVSTGLSNMLKDIATLTDEQMKSNASITFTINESELTSALTGLQVFLQLQCDNSLKEYALYAHGTLGTEELFEGTIFADETELAAHIPLLYAGTFVIPYDMMDDMVSMGEDIYSDVENIDPDFNYPSTDLDLGTLTDIELPEFDYETFSKGLVDSMVEAINTAATNMKVEDLGQKPLAGGNYYCYKATIDMEDIGDIIKAGVLYSLNNKELQSYMDAISQATDSSDDEELPEDLYFDYTIDMATQMSSMAAILDSYWPMLVGQIEAILGSNIEFTVYMTDNVDIVGYSLNIPKLFTLDIDLTSSPDCAPIEKPSTSPVYNIGQLSDEEFNGLMNTLYSYMDFFGSYGATLE